ncbi:MAG: HAD family phosphatase [Verrucomicrobia bacterium]|nr:HAD family phosphatase [Verrucomicrobiota bacterium]
MYKGLIALDIDGTITDATHTVPPQVVSYLHSLKEEGWELVFITGRTLSFARRAVHHFDFPFYLALQNGADLLHMPSMTSVSRHYLSQPAVAALDGIYARFPEDYLVYAGYQKGDFCYYRPGRFSLPLRTYLQVLKDLTVEPWQEVEDFHAIPSFPLIKCLGKRESMEAVDAALQKLPALVHATRIRDPLSEDLQLILVTAPLATKGHALRHIYALHDAKGPIIAAGDDLNDVEMLKNADFKIVMGTAPKEMHAMANFVAQPSTEQGIIGALQEATRAYRI